MIQWTGAGLRASFFTASPGSESQGLGRMGERNDPKRRDIVFGVNFKLFF